MSEVTVRPISSDQHDAVLHFFDLVAYADNPNWSKCFCIGDHVGGQAVVTRSL